MRNITILLHDNVMLSSLALPLDIFNAAGVFWNMLNEKEPTPFFKVKTVTFDGNPVRTYFGTDVKPDMSIHEAEESGTIIIPPSDADLTLAPETISWLIESHQKGVHIASFCLGTFLLAQTGLLKNKHATTHWGYADRFRQQYPNIKLDTDQLITDEGDLFTAGGANAGGDLALYLIAKYVEKEAAFQTAKVMVMDMDRSSQAPYLMFRIEKIHGDKEVLKIQNWLEKNFRNPISVDLLADKAAMTRRTFERRFKNATGYSPLRYIQRIRIEHAKQLLEKGGTTFDEITYTVGYEDSSTFGKIFKLATGLSPNSYKKRYSYAFRALQ
ncbi:GlxA family transcriptional regulator [Limisalsivibrio acetivorans]|uniref:GlxA family transcriptional regulator n=1 Tax=Limisalsivibrio acetivorans TaxID=1304888 RepID=UPI0003B77F18|nr:GlxA family transcriptional regulator [Limisalsivibrio acetivorans]